MEVLRDTFKALSDDTRLQIMVLLLENAELCVCDFVGALGQTQSKISRHLRYLHNSGLVKDRRDGLWMLYRISPALDAQQRAVLETLSATVSETDKQELRQALIAWLGRKGNICPC